MAKPDPKAPVTNEYLDGAINHVVEALGKMIEELAKKLESHDRRFDDLAAGQRDLKRQLNDLKLDTPTQKEFEALKTTVERHHPVN